MALADLFEIAERPVVLIDLEFDGGEINFWTRPFSGESAGKSYAPIAGLTGSLSIRQSLDRPSLDAGASIVGTSPEIKNAALTENFQLRPARITLGNLDSAGAVEDSEVILSGTMQDIPIVSDPEQGLNLSVVIESIFADIDVARDLRYSAADQEQFNPSDSFFDFVETVELIEPNFGA